MKIYEAKIRDTITLQNGNETKTTYLELYSSYIVSLSLWCPVSILYLGILFISFIEDWITRVKNSDYQILNLFKTCGLVMFVNWAIQLKRRWFKSPKKDTIQSISPKNDTIGSIQPKSITRLIPDRDTPDEMTRILATIRSNNFSTAFKYLCTCQPEHKTLARKPLRIDNCQTPIK